MRLIPKHQQAGYVTPQARPCCRNCQFMTGEENGLNQVTYWSCRKHGFEVRTGGICPDHPRAASAPGVAFPLRGSQRNGILVVPLEQSPAWGVSDQDDESPARGISSQAETSPEWGCVDQDEALRRRGGLTVAQHRRKMVLEMIASEEASGDPQLLRAAAFRRRSLGLEPRA